MVNVACEDGPIVGILHPLFAALGSGHAVTLLPPILVVRDSRSAPSRMVVQREISERREALQVGCAAIGRIGKDASNAVEAIDSLDQCAIGVQRIRWLS